jgi:hypothetical protein
MISSISVNALRHPRRPRWRLVEGRSWTVGVSMNRVHRVLLAHRTRVTRVMSCETLLLWLCGIFTVTVTMTKSSGGPVKPAGTAPLCTFTLRWYEPSSSLRLTVPPSADWIAPLKSA